MLSQSELFIDVWNFQLFNFVGFKFKYGLIFKQRITILVVVI